MTVSFAESGKALVPGSVLVIPPGFDGIVDSNGILLEKIQKKSSPHPSGNKLFISLAESCGARSVAIVLSGTGSDGALGAREVKAHGGFVIAQSPETAKYDSMPLATISGTSVDLILSPKEIAPAISGLLLRVAQEEEGDPRHLAEPPANGLFDRLLNAHNIDFRQYKSNTVSRRFARRIAATGCKSMADYNDYVSQHPEELERLYLDLIISVTAFFRDPEEYQAIRPHVATMLNTKKPGDEIRIWVPGCATGEEAYTTAILLHQILGSSAQSYRIQIFATDIDQTALAIARKGFYEAHHLKTLEPETLETYFQPSGSGYIVKKFLQDRVLFAQHNLTADPPFLHLDMISCRNLMIYFMQELQERILSVFYYGLEPHGILFLGKSESIGNSSYFRSIQGNCKLFRKIPGLQARAIRNYAQKHRPASQSKPLPQLESPEVLEDHVRRAIVDKFVNQGFVVDRALEIHYVYGDLARITRIARGKPAQNVQNLIAPLFQAEIRNLVYRLESQGGTLRSAPVYDDDALISFEGTPVSAGGAESPRLYFIRYFHQTIEASELIERGSDSANVLQLQQELSLTREHLQTAMEELQSSNEELQSVNEELQSSNEEQQSINEELETANEELQSSNEELLTVNDELNLKTEQLSVLNQDLINLQNSLPHPLLLVDEEFKITHHNKACHEIFKYENQLVRQPIHALATEYALPELIPLIKEAVSGGGARSVQISGERSYWLTVTPYREEDGSCRGAVLIFWNNTELLAIYRRLQETLTKSNLQARALEAAQQGIVIADASAPSFPLIYANSAFSKITGYAKEEVFGRNCRFLQGPATNPEVRARLSRAIKNQETFKGQLINYRKDGSEFHNMLELSPIFENGKLTHYLGIQTDITELVESEKESAFSRSVFENTQESIVILSEDHRVKYANPAASRMFGIPFKQLRNRSLNDKIKLSTLKTHNTFDSVWKTVKKQNRWQGQLGLTTDKKETPLLVSINRVRSPENIDPHYVMLASDITDLKKKETQLKRLATIDSLTGLPNRTLFRERLKEAVARAQRSKSRFALMFLDLDNFKRINDTMGHRAGDTILKHFARTVKALVRDNDTFARLSGDEFMLILDSLDNPSDAHPFAQRIIEAIAHPYSFDEGEILLSASIGVAIFPEDGNSAETLMRNADLAMYRAKQRGKAQVSFVDTERTGILWEQLRIEAALRKGLIEQEEVGLHLNFQPIYQAKDTSLLLGFEILIRWNHPKLGKLTPDQFLPLARSAGFSQALDLWVFRKFLSHYSSWQEKYPMARELRFSINIDPGNMNLLTKSQINVLLNDLDDSAVRPKLCLEITENGLIDANENFVAELEALREMDVKISIDDFGNGFSNFVYLTDLISVGQIKLDRSIVLEIDKNPTKLKRLRAIIRMLKEIGYQIVVEGIENEQQLALLEGSNHDCVQGYHLSRPLTAEQTESLMVSLSGQARPSVVPLPNDTA